MTTIVGNGQGEHIIHKAIDDVHARGDAASDMDKLILVTCYNTDRIIHEIHESNKNAFRKLGSFVRGLLAGGA